MLTNDLLFFCIAVIGGLSVGMAGIGSTLVTLPVLALVFPSIYPPQLAMKMVVATTLSTAAIAGASSAFFYWRDKQTEWRYVCRLAPVYFVIALVGPQIVHFLPAAFFQVLIGFVLLFLSAKMFLRARRKMSQSTKPLSNKRFLFTGCLAGLVNSITGIATGTIMVPFLSHYFPRRKAVAISVTSTVVACATAAVGYIIAGWSATQGLANSTLGYVDVNAFCFLAPGILIGTPIGVKLGKKITIDWFRYLLFLLLFASGITVLVKAF